MKVNHLLGKKKKKKKKKVVVVDESEPIDAILLEHDEERLHILYGCVRVKTKKTKKKNSKYVEWNEKDPKCEEYLKRKKLNDENHDP